MFVGHYAVSFGLKAYDTRLSLGWLFVGAMFYDIVWCLTVPLGIERIAMVPERYAWVPIEFEFIPYTHSLLGAVLWAGLVFVVFRVLAGATAPWKGRAAAWIAAATFSHWLLDVVVHRADLPLLLNNDYRVGLGLWNYRYPSLILEMVLILLGMGWYRLKTKPRTRWGSRGLFGFAALMVVMGVAFYFVRDVSKAMLMAFSFGSFGLLTAIAFWLDRHRD